MRTILFVCTGNTCRSPMAQGICEKLAADKGLPIKAESAGISTVNGSPVSDNAIEVCREIGVDISRFRTTSVRGLDLSKYDAIYTMSIHHKSALIALGANPYKVSVLATEDGGISDPYGGDLDTYRKCRDEIFDAIRYSLNEL